MSNPPIHDVTFPGPGLVRLTGPTASFTFPYTGSQPELLAKLDKIIALIGTPVVVPPAPVEVTTPRPAWVDSRRRVPVPLTDVTTAHKLLTVGNGKQFSTLGEAFAWVAADTGSLVPVIRVDPGDYIGAANQPAHGYCPRPFILEAADPDRMFRMIQGADGLYNGKSPLALNGPGVYEFNNVEASGFRNPNTGTRGNWAWIAPEWSVAGRMDVRVRGSLIYDSNNGMGRGCPDCHWYIFGSVVQHCGVNGEGYSHNFYLLGAEAVLDRVTSLEAQDGHLFKTRTMKTAIHDSWFLDREVGTSSYRLDFPDGGDVTLDNLLLHNGKNATNRPAIHFGGEDPAAFHPSSSLTVRDVTTVNERFEGMFLRNQSLVMPDVLGSKMFGIDPRLFYDDGQGGAMPDQNVTILPTMPSLA